MRLQVTLTCAPKTLRLGLFAALLFSAACAGCENYCIVINSNPGGTTGSTFTCPVTKSTGNISITLGASTAGSESALVRPPHVFVTLRGIDALPVPNPGEEAPAWREFAPRLALHPVQLDLAAHAGDSCAMGPLGSADVPAGVYSQLRLVANSSPSQPASVTSPLDGSACGENIFNCFIPPDAAPQPIVWDDPAEIVIPGDRIGDGFVRVLPDTSVHLSIELDPRFTRAVPASASSGAGVRLVPAFTASTRASCNSDE